MELASWLGLTQRTSTWKLPSLYKENRVLSRILVMASSSQGIPLSTALLKYHHVDLQWTDLHNTTIKLTWKLGQELSQPATAQQLAAQIIFVPSLGNLREIWRRPELIPDFQKSVWVLSGRLTSWIWVCQKKGWPKCGSHIEANNPVLSNEKNYNVKL